MPIYQDTPEKIKFSKNIKIVDVKGGYSFTLFLVSSGELYKAGQFNSKQKYYIPTLLSTKVVGKNDKIIGVSCGQFHFICVSSRGNVYSMGENEYGQLGLGTTDDSGVIKRIKLLRANRIKSISCGPYHSILLTERRKIIYFGNRFNEKYVIGNKIWGKPTFMKVTSLKNVEQIHCGNRISYAITKEGKLYWRGQNVFHQPGTESAKFILIEGVNILRRNNVKLWAFDPFKCKKTLDVIINCDNF